MCYVSSLHWRNIIYVLQKIENTGKKIIHVTSNVVDPCKYYTNKKLRNKINDLASELDAELHVSFYYCGVIFDTNIFKSVHLLSLELCKNITDVDPLNSVHNLNLSGCHNIDDVSMLGNVHTLHISNCQNITDVNMLGNVHTLNISNC